MSVSVTRPCLVGLGVLLSSVALIHGCADETSPPPPSTGDGFHDPLAMPEQPTLSVDSFAGASSCASCHPTHHDEWRTSTHAYAMVDPVFRALVAVRQSDFGGEQDQFCVQCHSAIATRGGEIVDGFSFDALSPIALEGVGCEACHKISEVVRPFNSGHRLDPEGPMRAGIADPQVDGSVHGAASSEIFGTSMFCAGCHDVIEVNGLELERPYGEWLESPSLTQGTRCQDCHMATREAPAAVGGPMRTTHDHRFVGVDVPLADGFVTEDERATIRSRAAELLDGAASLSVDASSVRVGEPMNVVVTVTNNIAGHNLPTGTTFVRELWVELTARDASGALLYQTGDLDENGDLRHHFSSLDRYGDADLLLFNATLITDDGEPTIFPWRAAELRSTAIPPRYARTFTLFVPTDAMTEGPIQIDARLRFRTHGPHLLRRLGLEALVPRIPIFDIESASAAVDVAP